VRLIKYATYPVAAPRPAGGPDAPAFIGLERYSLASHLTSEMLELGQAHACHRFVVEDQEEEKPRLLVSRRDLVLGPVRTAADRAAG
jgi:hypothetical protein